MYLLAHAMVGLLIGVVLAAIASDRRVIALTVLGAVLPDLIDKPLGHIILAGTLGYGRIYFHGLTVLFLVVIAGLILYHYRRRIGLFAVAAGMASHQFLDGMWWHPVEWFWPFLGPLQNHGYSEDYFWESVLRELAQPSEWLFFLLITGLFAYIYRQELTTVLTRLANPSFRLALVAALGLAVLAALAVGGRLLL
ncbi:metal-dependent hydrolase [Methanoculleus sp. YWC-01]|uniref:Metal-dependent hydrolase n=2 Tax=Methanoculleus nereidis TaxID=2735141 RepID=A0ABU3YZA2_9EURY|nr:metal-dependent hydrolase [Methanoculleus sp. YWC-01]PKL55704.1 MAG: metal-dependent hydrolase [Methanomicrobiales archaeon HGW-Methanomicrobiales-6]